MNISDYPEFDKLVVSGSRVEHLQGRLSVARPSAEAIRLGVLSRKLKQSSGLPPSEQSLLTSVARSRSKLTRLIHANSWVYRDSHGVVIPPKFLTLTFHKNIASLSEANIYLTKFIRQVNSYFAFCLPVKLKYVCVPEFQERGAIHYHLVLFNLPFADRIFTKLRKFWPDRFELKAISRQGGVSYISDYLIKYLTKQSLDARFFNKKRYSVSRGVILPFVSRDALYNHLVVDLVKSYSVKYYGLSLQTGFLHYNLYKLPDGSRSLDKLVRKVLSKTNRGSE